MKYVEGLPGKQGRAEPVGWRKQHEPRLCDGESPAHMTGWKDTAARPQRWEMVGDDSQSGGRLGGPAEGLTLRTVGHPRRFSRTGGACEGGDIITFVF